GGDILNGKKSWLTIRALEKTGDKAAFLAAFEAAAETPEQKAEKISRVKGMYDDLGVGDDARAEIRRLSDRAMEAVKGMDVATDSLRQFADSLVGRAK
ncbi:MAG: hypothetical protein IJ799_00970, partial [Bacteroidales bacterium]|nr:hypothetical protein [Bacteroidales bacterium]